MEKEEARTLKGIREGGSCDVHISITESSLRTCAPGKEGGRREGGREEEEKGKDGGGGRGREGGREGEEEKELG